MEYHQRIQAVSPLVLRVGLPLSYRILFGAFAVFMAAIMFDSGSLSVIPGVLFLIAIGAAFFVDEWCFDAERHETRHRRGWLIFLRETTLSVEEVAGIRYQIAGARTPRQPFHHLSIVKNDGTQLTIDIGTGRTREMADTARLLAQHLEVDLLS